MLLLIVLAPIAGCANKAEINKMDSRDSNSNAIAIIQQYVAKQKAWSPRDYRIERTGREDGCVIYSVIYLADEKVPYPGGGKSIELYYDPDQAQDHQGTGFSVA